MLDNCPGMRGEVSGVETRLKEVQPDLLPLGGDTVHMCHTAAKELLKALDGGIEAFLLHGSRIGSNLRYPGYKFNVDLETISHYYLG